MRGNFKRKGASAQNLITDLSDLVLPIVTAEI